MKMFLYGAAALGIGGAAMTGTMSGHDVERTIAKPSATVYAAVSAMADEGEQTSDDYDGDGKGRYTLRVEKEEGRSIQYEMLLDGRTIGDVKFGFEAKDAATTRLTADLDIDKAAVGEAFGEGGQKFAAIPDAVINMGFANIVDELAAKIEAGETLSSLKGYESRMRQGNGPSLAARREAALEQQRAAAAPMTRAEPMVDPHQAARDYLRGTN